MNSRENDRQAWVDLAKGICIVTVVTLYTTNYVNEALGRPNWMDYWIAFARPFRMPDFFLLSGLFLSRVIDRPWKTYLDKKVLHYAYFLVLWTIIIVPFTWQERDFHPSAVGAVKDYIWHIYEPWAMLWFIQTLAVYFVFTRLVRHVPWWIVLGGAALMQISAYHTGIPPLDWFGERYVFFYAGYSFARNFFSLARWAQENRGTAVLALICWAVINEVVVLMGLSTAPGILLILGFAGAAAVMTVAALLTKFKSMNWLRYLGQNSIVIYLGFYLPMRWLLAALISADFVGDPGAIAVIVGVGAIVSAVVFFRITRATWLSLLFARPRWAQLTNTSDSTART